MLLAIDQSLTRTGYCFVRRWPNVIIHGSFAPDDVHDFVRKLMGLIDEREASSGHRVSGICYEAPINAISRQMTGMNAGQLKLHQLVGAITAIGIGKGVELISVTPKTWRKAVLGNGALPKDAAKRVAKEWCIAAGIDVRNHDEAEAVCIASYAVTLPEYRYRKEIANQS